MEEIKRDGKTIFILDDEEDQFILFTINGKKQDIHKSQPSSSEYKYSMHCSCYDCLHRWIGVIETTKFLLHNDVMEKRKEFFRKEEFKKMNIKRKEK